MYQFDCGVCSDVGVLRGRNEDNFYLNGVWNRDLTQLRTLAAEQCQEALLCAVCDGMGGGQYGAHAALAAVESLAAFTPQHFPDQIDGCVRRAGQAVCRMQAQMDAQDMGTTLACLAVSGGQATAFNLGDSRIYRLRGGQLTQLSQDHTNAQRLLAAGLPCQPRDFHILTQFLGIPLEEMRLEPFVSGEIPLQDRDRFLLCSDGLSGVLTHGEIAAVLGARRGAAETARLCVQTALAQGSSDNVTAAVIIASRWSRPGFLRRLLPGR